VIIDYLADNLGCGCHRTLEDAIGGGATMNATCQSTDQVLTLADLLQTMAAQPPVGMQQTPPAPTPVYRRPETPPPPMDNTRAFAPLSPSARASDTCRSCGRRGGVQGRGDVNVNVNVATGGSQSSSGTEASAGSAPGAAATPPLQATTPDATQTARIVREEIAQALRERPSFEGPTRVEYRPFAVPTDRVIRKTEYKPFAVVWDRIKRTFVDRDVKHPIDRVRTIPGRVVKGSFEGTSATQSNGATRP
jgi:hypothetical protein